MRVTTTTIALLCAALMLVGSLRLLARETVLVASIMGLVPQADTDNSGTAGNATEAVSLDAPDDAVLAELTEFVDGKLRARPTGSLFWLWLAQTRLRQSPKGFNAALRLSVVTAPREAEIMLERAIVGLQFWDVLNAQLRRFTMADLVALLPRLNRQPLERVKAAISTQDFSSQQEIAAAVVERSNARGYLQRLGVSNAYTQ
jgi:hypothetical protein